MTALARGDLTRLVKLLRMLESESVGERAAAALKVVEFVQSRGLDWAKLLQPEDVLPTVTVTVAPDPHEAPTVHYPTPQDAMARHQEFLRAQVAAQAQATAQAMHNAGLGAAFNQGMQGAPSPPFAGQYASGVQGAQGTAPPGSANDGRLGGQMADWKGVATALLTWHAAVLRGSKEREFVESRIRSGFDTLTDRQDAWLRDIARRANLSWSP